MENVVWVTFLTAAPKQADQHMADRPPPPISCIRMQGSSHKMFLLYFTSKKRLKSVLSVFTLFTQGTIHKKASCTGRERV